MPFFSPSSSSSSSAIFTINGGKPFLLEEFKVNGKWQKKRKETTRYDASNPNPPTPPTDAAWPTERNRWQCNGEAKVCDGVALQSRGRRRTQSLAVARYVSSSIHFLLRGISQSCRVFVFVFSLLFSACAILSIDIFFLALLSIPRTKSKAHPSVRPTIK